METIGWVFESKDFKTFKTQHSLFDIENALLEILSFALTGKQIDILMKAINAFKSLGSDDLRLRAFEKHTHSLQQGNFQLGFVSEEDHMLSMVVSAFILSSKKNITRILFFTAEKEAAQLAYISTNVTLNEAVYSHVRNAIKDKLGDISSFVADLPL